jgi:hypothetical protein
MMQSLGRLSAAAAMLAFVPGVALAPSTSAQAATDSTYSFAVIGDVPYGEPLITNFPGFIGQINADPDVRFVTHLGDIKSGSSRCDTTYFEKIYGDFKLFEDPLVYTPGDNEWTDCHRANNGGYNPLERLDTVRRIFFAEPNRTLGKQVAITSQDSIGFPENRRYVRADVCFATLHVVGSNDDLLTWTGNTGPRPEQVAEQANRMAANIANVRRTFQQAKDDGCRAVVLQQQADMFDVTVPNPDLSGYSAFKPLVQTLIDQSNQYDGPVYLFNGDSHVFNQDRPLAAGSSWLSFYGVTGSAANLQRVTVDGSRLGENDWLKVTVHSAGSDVLTFEKVPGASS